MLLIIALIFDAITMQWGQKLASRPTAQPLKNLNRIVTNLYRGVCCHLRRYTEAEADTFWDPISSNISTVTSPYWTAKEPTTRLTRPSPIHDASGSIAKRKV